MWNVVCKDQQIIYNAYHLVKAFFADDEVSSALEETQEWRICIYLQKADDADHLAEKAKSQADGADLFAKKAMSPERDCIHAQDMRELYEKLRALTGRDLPWGMLTGVRPVKLASKWLKEEADPDLPRDQQQEWFVKWFADERFVSREKGALAFQVACREQTLLQGLEGGYSLYIGIPFCPSVCSYCSFSSGPIDRYQEQVDVYLEALFAEMEQVAQKCEAFRLYPSTIYIGGGTPTSLSSTQLWRLLSRAEELFHIKKGLALGKVREYTVEAGRPDSITEEKLRILKEFQVTRISINPQTMQQKTLDRIGRKHTVQQVTEAFWMARKLGFDNINMDLIAGLPGEDAKDMQDTLQQILALHPDSLTVHSLAVKRTSAIGTAQRIQRKQAGSEEDSMQTASIVGRMIADASAAAHQMGMDPYYLYRQKSIAGNFENIGYACPGKEGLYNILIMEEVQSIYACGAGATTKIVLPKEQQSTRKNGQMTRLVRTENGKDIATYIRKYLPPDRNASVALSAKILDV